MPKPSPVSSLKPLIAELRICKDMEAAARTDVEWAEDRLKTASRRLREANRQRERMEFAIAEAIDTMTRSAITDEMNA